MSDATESAGRAAAAATIRAAAILLCAWAAIVALTGGLDLRPYGFTLRSTDPIRPAIAALLLFAAYAAAFRSRAAADLEWLADRIVPAAAAIVRRSGQLVLVLAVAVFALGMWFGLHVAAGSDSWGYISQARLWLERDLVVEQPIATVVPWPDADWTFAPLGYRPAVTPGAIVPVYAPGLSILMALGTLIAGACGPYIVVPLFGALLVWLTYRVGTEMWSASVGLLSAALMATSPTFLFMLMNPMSDVPVSAFFAIAFAIALTPWRSRAFWTGAAVSVAILIRPNLVPVGLVFLGLVLARSAGHRWRAAIAYGVGGLPLTLLVAAVNTHLYGAPWKAGYGSLDQFYSWSYPVPNLIQYSGWLLATETPFIALMLVPLVVLRRLDARRRLVLTCAAALVAAVWLCYLFYAPYDVWWYLRFLLPAFPGMLILAAIGFVLVLRRFVDRRRVLAAALAAAVPLFAIRAGVIRNHGLLSLWQGGVVYVSAAQYVRNELPPNAVILTVQHSGSIRHYAERLTLRWDLLGAEWWPRAFEVLVQQGYRPYLLVSSYEEEQLRERFGLSDRVDAPGTVVAEMSLPEAFRIYDPLRESTGAADVVPPVTPCPCGSEP